MKIVLLERDSVGRDIDVSGYGKYGKVIEYSNTPKELIAERVKDADIVVINKCVMNEETLKDALNLKLIAISATGYDVVDLEYCKKRGIRVANVSNYSTDAVVQHTFALTLYLLEKLPHYDTYVKSGAYGAGDCFSYYGKSFWELAGKTWGIIGMGNIGKKVATIAKAFGCNVIYYSASGNTDLEEYERVSLEDLCRRSDVLSLHCPLSDRTRGIINKQTLSLMKPSAILINVARGPIVKQQDLYDALMNGTIAAAGLDVLEKEPIAADNPLGKIMDSEKLIITPHLAWASTESRTRLVQGVMDNVRDFVEGKDRAWIV
ncbi:MAG: D-2-hydroxyacid dehydrogenase [Lachnospiraceae bacterium]|nr:D-2-hydroxyacid dehydrogenase [Lachnospiraceae bacterium]